MLVYNDMIFKTMDPQKVRELLEGHENIIAPEVEKHQKYFESLKCDYCGGKCMAIVLDGANPFKEGAILPDYQAECVDCGAHFTPYTGIEVRGPIRNPLEDPHHPEPDSPLKPDEEDLLAIGPDILG